MYSSPKIVDELKSVTYLSGEILEQDGKTFVRFTASPNITFTILFLAAPVMASIIFIITGKIQFDAAGLIGEGTFLIGIPLFMLFTCVISKRITRKRFIKAFGLQECINYIRLFCGLR